MILKRGCRTKTCDSPSAYPLIVRFIRGTIALLLLSVTYHGIFNMLVQFESLKYYGFFLPAVTYIPIVIAQIRSAKKKAAKNK